MAVSRTGAVVLASLVVCIALFFVSAPASADTINCSHQNNICQGTKYWDLIYGGPNYNEVSAKEGRDDVWGYASGDFLFGMEDGDTLYGGTGFDYLYGQSGNDGYQAVGEGAGLYGNSENDQIEGWVGFDYLEGNYGNDALLGGDHDDWLFAQDGQSDTVNGGNSTGAEPCWVDGYDSFYSCDAS